MSGSARAGRGVKATWIFAALIFVGGVGVGSGGVYWFIGHALQDGVVERGKLPERMARKAARDLDLTSADERSLKDIYRRRHELLSATHDESMARLAPELSALDLEITALLGPEKAALWNERWAEKRGRWAPRGRRREAAMAEPAELNQQH